MALKKRVFAFVSLILLGSFVLHYFLPPKGIVPSTTLGFSTPGKQKTGPCSKRLNLLRNLTIDFPVKYSRREIVVRPTPGAKRASITKINELLFPEFQTIDLTDDIRVDLKTCLDPLVLDIPLTTEQPWDASHLIFGMSTTLNRLEQSIIFLQRWLPRTQARLFVLVVGPDDTAPNGRKMTEMESRMRSLEMNVTIVKPLDKTDGMPERYFSLIKLMYAHRDSNTQWISLIDDDTFFPSMQSLTQILGAHEPDKDWYIGGMSEEWWTVARYGMMGFGGAGIFLSIPLASVLDANYEDCKQRSGSGSGDVRVMECVYWHTNTKLTHLPGLYQIDLHGDRSGLFESGRLALSLHHWKEGWWDEGGYGSWFPMHKMHLVSDVCGDCFLQRWQFGTDMILSNGYSIAAYPGKDLNQKKNGIDLEKIEHTWLTPAVVEGSLNKGFDHYVGPGRPMLELEKEKIQYRFLDAIAIDGGVAQFYIHLGVDGELDTLVELFWIVEGVFNYSVPTS